MELFFENKTDIASPLNKKEITRVINAVLREEGRKPAEPWEVNIVLVSERDIREMNNNYRKINRATDVLSFASGEGEGSDYAGFLLGDIVVSPDIVMKHAEKYGVSFVQELSFVLIHGMLHLLGHDHDSEKERSVMREKENIILKKLGFVVENV